MTDINARSHDRIYAMRWLERQGLIGRDDIKDIIRRIGVDDQDESVRTAARAIYESYVNKDAKSLAGG